MNHQPKVETTEPTVTWTISVRQQQGEFGSSHTVRQSALTSRASAASATSEYASPASARKSSARDQSDA